MGTMNQAVGRLSPGVEPTSTQTGVRSAISGENGGKWGGGEEWVGFGGDACK